jgi:hypothetical protein
LGDCDSTKIITICDPVLFLKEWEDSSGSEKTIRPQ